MKRLMIRLVVGLLGLFAIVYTVGALLPSNHSASVSVHVPVPPETVWAAIIEVQSQPEWREGVDSVVVTSPPGGRLAWIEYSGGEALPLAAEIAAPPRILVTRIDTDALPFGGRWTTEIGAEDGGSRVTITEEGLVRPPVFRFVSRFVIGHDATIRAYLDALVTRLGGP